MSILERPQSERDFEEAVRRASEQQKLRKARIAAIERRAQESPEEALRVAAVLRYRARNGRRHLRRYLKSRWGIKVYARDPAVSYAVLWPERSPQGSQERLQRAVAIVKHGEWEAIWMAVRKGFDLFGPTDQGRMACKFAAETMRQTPALWGFFIEREREPDDSVREYAAARLAGWLDNETRLYPRTRKAVGGKEGKLQEIAASVAEAWADLQPGEPFWLPNTFVGRFNEKRKKGSLAGRGSSYMDSLPDLKGIEAEEPNPETAGTVDQDLAEFEAAETSRQQLNALIEKAGLSEQQAAVIGRLRSGEEIAHISAELGISENQVSVQQTNAVKKLKKAAGQ